eukprot:CAMPEP_0170549360 /NCGR_PEP_ID=MMETSP0211-20121228/7514_1 /TAXON_ID=311385 /ORGANISM="Pseudokeronopsis sp., Strain OXSARD2" /LENGTH=48 /DNA_ID= /DNA_START= /DNA_END= /DNA_ORIENTATION=
MSNRMDLVSQKKFQDRLKDTFNQSIDLIEKLEKGTLDYTQSHDMTPLS